MISELTFTASNWNGHVGEYSFDRCCLHLLYFSGKLLIDQSFGSCVAREQFGNTSWHSQIIQIIRRER